MPTDPTFETQGPMRVFFTNNTDNGGTNGFPLDVNSPSYSFFGPYMQSQQAALTYGPPGTPPPPWTRGTDWDVIASKSVAPVNFPVVAGGQYGYSAGNAEVLRISDRSPSKVALGGQYTFDLPFGIIATHLSIHLIVTGVAGGSTVLPGFGLWNLGSNPHAWTYLTPTAFDGTWSIELRSDDFLGYATLSLTYVRYSGTSRFGPMSRLVYSVSGIGMCWPYFTTPTGTTQAPPSFEPVPRDRASTIDVIRSSGHYQARAGGVLEPA